MSNPTATTLHGAPASETKIARLAPLRPMIYQSDGKDFKVAEYFVGGVKISMLLLY